MYDLLLKNAWVVDPLNSVNGVADVAIQEGKIAKLQRDIQEEAKEVIDYTGKTLQPGDWPHCPDMTATRTDRRHRDFPAGAVRNGGS